MGRFTPFSGSLKGGPALTRGFRAPCFERFRLDPLRHGKILERRPRRANYQGFRLWSEYSGAGIKMKGSLKGRQKSGGLPRISTSGCGLRKRPVGWASACSSAESQTRVADHLDVTCPVQKSDSPEKGNGAVVFKMDMKRNGMR